MKFALRKAEKFVKTVAIELHIPSEETGDNEVYAPRFLDEIADEIDTLENKKDTLFCKLLSLHSNFLNAPDLNRLFSTLQRATS